MELRTQSSLNPMDTKWESKGSNCSMQQEPLSQAESPGKKINRACKCFLGSQLRMKQLAFHLGLQLLVCEENEGRKVGKTLGESV